MAREAVPGYGVEEHEVQAVLDFLVGERDPGVDPLARYAELSSRQTLLAEVGQRIADLRAQIGYDIYRSLGEGRRERSFAWLAELVGTSRSRAQQFVERGRVLAGTTSPAQR
jgi:hypothetical protein